MRTVIVIGMPVFLPAVETTPSIWYHELYRTVNELLDANAYHLASCLNVMGHAPVSVLRDGYGSVRVLLERPVAFFSHRHAAYLAGLGTFGVNNALLTPAYGPRVRFASIFTSAELPSDPVIETDLCTHCVRCVKFCPAGVLKAGDYPGSLTDKRVCAEQSVALAARHISPCGQCIAVCPVGEDRRLFTRKAVGYRDYKDENYNDLPVAGGMSDPTAGIEPCGGVSARRIGKKV